MDLLGEVRKGPAHIDLKVAPVLLRIPGVDNGVLQLNERILTRGVELFGTHEGGDKSARAIRVWRLAFDGER